MLSESIFTLRAKSSMNRTLQGYTLSVFRVVKSRACPTGRRYPKAGPNHNDPLYRDGLVRESVNISERI